METPLSNTVLMQYNEHDNYCHMQVIMEDNPWFGLFYANELGVRLIARII